VAASPLALAEDGRPSRDALAAMGLGGMTVMSDDAAMSIRGHGYQGGGTKSIARAWGSSFANYETPHGDSHTENGYFAEGKHKAKGSNLSYAGVIKIQTKPGHGGGDYGNGPRSSGGGYGGGGHGGGISIKATVVFAGGSSSAWAF
jgi:hypothetical protein